MGGSADDTSGPGRFRFGDIVVDEAAHLLLRDGKAQAVEPKAFAVLVALLRRPGELVARDDLLDQVWGHRHVTPGVLTRAIAQLRAALGDDPQHPRYIQTRHALGYSFVGDLQESGSEHAAVESTPLESVAEPASADPEPSIPAGRGTREDPSVAHRHRHWRFRHWIAVSLVAMVLFVAMAWNEQRSKKDRALAPSVAVMPFANLGQDRDTDYFAQGLAVEMHDALASVGGLKVAAYMQPSESTPREPDARELGRRLGVATILDASVRRDGGRLRINARLTDTSNGYTLWSRSYERADTDVFATQSEIAKEVVNALVGKVRLDSHHLSRRLAPTSNVAAFDSYLKGLWQLQHASDDADASRAIDHFRDALSRDAGFARAQTAVCRSERWRFVNVRDAGAYQRAHAACARAAEMDPDSTEVELEMADLNRVGGDVDKALQHYRRAASDPALVPDVYLGLASVESAKGRVDLAIEYFARALALRPADATILGRIGYQHYLAGRLQEATAAYRQAAELRPDDEGLWSTLGGLYLATGRYEAARQAFEHSIGISPTDAALSNYGELRYLEQDYAMAAELFRRALEVDDADFRIWGNLGNALRAGTGTGSQAHDAYAEAARRAEGYVSVDAANAEATAALAWYLANLGQGDRALRLANEASRLAPADGEVALLNAQTFASEGDRASALGQIGVARQSGVAQARLDANPFLSALLQPEHETGDAGTRPTNTLPDRPGKASGVRNDDTGQ